MSMHPRRWIYLVAFTATACLAVATGQGEALAQSVCTSNGEAEIVDLGAPDANGVTLTNQLLENLDKPLGYRFVTAAAKSAFVYVGDQWYDLDLALYSVAKGRTVACWQTTGAKARSERSQRRVLQFIRPDEQIVDELEPGVYVLLVTADPALVLDPFHPRRDFTIRVALTAPLCGGLDPPNRPNPAYPELMMRADDALYQLGITVAPPDPGPFDLITFSATVSPPYTDLFDYVWEVDGRTIPGATDLTFQVAADVLPQAPAGLHRVRVTAKGARPYPDPDQPHTPPTLSVVCAFGLDKT
jgi:hypothetical protein